MKKGGRPQRNFTEEQKQLLRKALDHPDLLMMNPCKKDNFYVGKVDGEKRYEPKRYLLSPIRDILNILNMFDAQNDLTYKL